MKTNHRLDYTRLAEVLAERGLVEPHALNEALQYSSQGSLPFPEALVSANLVADWELSRIVCELYGLPFLVVDQVEVDARARERIDPQFLIDNGLVPLSAHGKVLTVCMPAMVPADVLGLLSAESDLFVLPVVGTVLTNRRWIERHLATQGTPIDATALPPLPALPSAEESNAWGSIFDQGDAAVLLDLNPVDGEPES